MSLYEDLGYIVDAKVYIKQLQEHPEQNKQIFEQKKNKNKEYSNYKKPQIHSEKYKDEENKIDEEISTYDEINKLSNELSKYIHIEKNDEYFDVNQLLLFIEQNRNIISDYYNHKNEIKSYAKQYEFYNLLEDRVIVNYIQELAKLYCEQDKLICDE